MTDSMGPGKLFRLMQNPPYTYDEYLVCIGLGPSILSVICNNPSYSGPSYPSSPSSSRISTFLNIIRISSKGCANDYKVLSNKHGVINERRSKWTTQLNEETDNTVVANSLRIHFHAFVRFIQFKFAHLRVMTNACISFWHELYYTTSA